MNINNLIESTQRKEPPNQLSEIHLALWYALKGDWDMAHNITQDIQSETASWIHAYLHRKEGDIGNAHYWYRRANKKPYSGSLKAELDEIVKTEFT